MVDLLRRAVEVNIKNDIISVKVGQLRVLVSRLIDLREVPQTPINIYQEKFKNLNNNVQRGFHILNRLKDIILFLWHKCN